MKEDHEIIELYWARSESAVHETDEKYGAKLHTHSLASCPKQRMPRSASMIRT